MALTPGHEFGVALREKASLTCSISVIVGHRTQEQVVWPHTNRVIATVADAQLTWLLPVLKGVGYPVSHQPLAIIPNLPVAIGPTNTGPRPSTWLFVYLFPEPFRQCSTHAASSRCSR